MNKRLRQAKVYLSVGFLWIVVVGLFKFAWWLGQHSTLNEEAIMMFVADLLIEYSPYIYPVILLIAGVVYLIMGLYEQRRENS